MTILLSAVCTIQTTLLEGLTIKTRHRTTIGILQETTKTRPETTKIPRETIKIHPEITENHRETMTTTSVTRIMWLMVMIQYKAQTIPTIVTPVVYRPEICTETRSLRTMTIPRRGNHHWWRHHQRDTTLTKCEDPRLLLVMVEVNMLLWIQDILHWSFQLWCFAGYCLDRCYHCYQFHYFVGRYILSFRCVRMSWFSSTWLACFDRCRIIHLKTNPESFPVVPWEKMWKWSMQMFQIFVHFDCMCMKSNAVLTSIPVLLLTVLVSLVSTSLYVIMFKFRCLWSLPCSQIKMSFLMWN